MKKGNNTMEAVVILVVLVIIMITSATSSPDSTVKQTQPSNSSENTVATSGANGVASKAPRAPSISLSTGNARFTYQPYEEYITIYNTGPEPIDITHWKLKNAKDKRSYDFGGTLRHFTADTAVIPQAVAFIMPNGLNSFQNIILKPGENAVVTTGSMGSQLPYKIVSFKENKCSGYLNSMPEYQFTPSLSHDCPRPADELGVSSLDTECRRFIERMSSCRTPTFNTRNSEGDVCHNCVDGKMLSSSCVAFIKSHFNYGSCIAYHSNDSDFSGQTWRIFLNKSWEMWADRYETVTLLDQMGRLIKEKSY